ncbi:MAG: uracil-DNA glycosylase, partial [Gammaproteobacteria bacterium]
MSSNRKQALASLHRGIERCRKCRLHAQRRHAVPGEGPPDAPLMLVGEAPGEQEDREGKPFCGRSGAFLDRLLQSIGVDRQDVYITSSVKCRPPGNRKPRADELERCREAWLEKQLAVVRPRLLVLLGSTALRQVLGETGAMGDVRGKVLYRNGGAVLPTYHPAAGMRFPELGRQMKA